jgi:plastocyanin
MSRLTSILGLVALAAVLAACSGASAAPATADPSSGTTGSTGDATSITAKDMQFVQKDVTVKAGSAFAIAFDNKDGAPHNIAISDSTGAKVFEGSIVSGQAVTYSVPSLAAGTYTFICQVHPDMKGTITAK